VERHFEDYVRAHEERYERRSGPLRRVVRASVEAYLDCGRPHGGFARIRCPRCGGEHLLAFSCRTRNLCPSCQSKRSALFAERLLEGILFDVAHRHVVFTVPKALRGLIERERRLHGLMARAAWETLRGALSRAACEPKGVPGAVASLQTFGSFANFHPHLHVLVTEGVFTKDGRFHPVIWPTANDLEERFRDLFLEGLRRAERLSEAFEEALLSWPHSGFSVNASQRVAVGEGERLERLARYVTRVAMAVGVVKEREDGEVEVTTPPDPRTGARVRAMDALDFVHAVVEQIPDAGMHLVRYYGAVSNRRRRALKAAQESRPPDPPAPKPPDAAPPGSGEARRRSAWARLLQRVFEVDPLTCPRCGVGMQVVAWITDVETIDRILRHRRDRGLFSPFEARAPPSA
jgi:hypothetical protein